MKGGDNHVLGQSLMGHGFWMVLYGSVRSCCYNGYHLSDPAYLKRFKEGRAGDSPDVLKKRYARSEITKEEFEKIKDDLTKT